MSVPSSYMEVGEGELPYNLGYIGKCSPKEYGFSGVLVINSGLTLINSSLIASITKFSLVIGSPRAYFGSNRDQPSASPSSDFEITRVIIRIS